MIPSNIVLYITVHSFSLFLMKMDARMVLIRKIESYMSFMLELKLSLIWLHPKNTALTHMRSQFEHSFSGYQFTYGLVREEIGVLTSLPLLRRVVADLEAARNNDGSSLTTYFTKVVFFSLPFLFLMYYAGEPYTYVSKLGSLLRSTDCATPNTRIRLCGRCQLLQYCFPLIGCVAVSYHVIILERFYQL